MDSSFLLLPEAPPCVRSRLPGSSLTDEDVPMHVRRYGTRQRIYTAGDTARAIYEVAQGSVLISRYLGDGRRQIVDIIGPGRLFGFASDLHCCTAEVALPSMVCSLDRDAAQKSPAVARRVHAAMLRELDHLRDIAVLLGRKTAIERVATLLIALAGHTDRPTTTLSLPLSRAEMADYLGLTVETVSRTLTRLKQRALIGMRDTDTVTILNPDEMKRIARGEIEEAA